MQAKIWNNRYWINETDQKKLYKHYKDILLQAGFTIIEETEHFFQPFGYTALFLIAESHFAIHTFPEHSKTYIELSSCNEKKQIEFMKLDNWNKNK